VLYVHRNVLSSCGLQLWMFFLLVCLFCFFVSGLKMVMKVLMNPRENNVFYGEETSLNFLYLVNELGCCWLLSFGVLEFGLFADQW
jgi:hypothetical protein